MALPKKLKDLCSPALLYFIISMISFFVILLQNLGNSSSFTVGSFSCMVPNTAFIFVLKFTYIVFWTWILNLICNFGLEWLSWIFVLLPFIIMFILVITGSLNLNNLK